MVLTDLFLMEASSVLPLCPAGVLLLILLGRRVGWADDYLCSSGRCRCTVPSGFLSILPHLHQSYASGNSVWADHSLGRPLPWFPRLTQYFLG